MLLERFKMLGVVIKELDRLGVRRAGFTVLLAGHSMLGGPGIEF